MASGTTASSIAFLHHAHASTSASHFSDAFSDWLKSASVPPSWRGARVQCAPAAATEECARPQPVSEDEDEDLVLVSELTLADCAVGDWVEVRAARPRQPAEVSDAPCWWCRYMLLDRLRVANVKSGSAKSPSSGPTARSR
jgi:hypothetical protein